MEIYAPLADRMGMHRIRDELEDLSFEILNEDARMLIKDRLDKIKKDKATSFCKVTCGKCSDSKTQYSVV